MVNDGKAHFGWAEPSAVWAVNGVVLYNKKHENLRAIAGGLQFANLQAFALKRFAEEKKIATLEDLKKSKPPVRIVTKKKGTLGQAGAPLQLEAYGIKYDDIKAWGGRIVETDVPEIVNMMKDGRADLWLDNLAPGHPAATELYQSVDMVIVEHTPQGMEYLTKYGFYPQPVPANTWKGQTKEIKQPGGVTLMTTHKDIPADLVYTVTKAIGENAEEIRKSHAVMKHFDEKIAWRKDRALITLHPGAEKYYREKGWMK
jgi:TRAP transporter TAXI family solute receptor